MSVRQSGFLIRLAVAVTVTAATAAVLLAGQGGNDGPAVGLDDLADRIGAGNVPTGAGVFVGQVELPDAQGDYSSNQSLQQFAGKLLSAAYSAGLVVGRRDPRGLAYLRITDEALGYFLHVLREVRFEGTLIDNPYFRSVGLGPAELEQRLARLRGLGYSRMGDVTDFGWCYPGLAAWAEAEVVDSGARP